MFNGSKDAKLFTKVNLPMLTVPNIGNKFHNLDSCILGQSGIQHLEKGK